MRTDELAWRIRRHAIEMTHVSKLAHAACAFSIVDIIAVLYNDVMRIFPKDPKNSDRDRFILSEGHCIVALAAALAEKGFFPCEELLGKFVDGGKLTNFLYPGGVPGVECATETLGLGFPIACGMAYAAKKDNKTHNVYSIIGDGECNEGSVWEAALFCGHHNLSNMTVIINRNNIQAQDRCENILSLTNLSEMWTSFGWHVMEADGHDIEQLKNILGVKHGEKPVCIIAHTTKGKGVSFMENEVVWHYLCADGEQYDTAVKELEAKRP